MRRQLNWMTLIRDIHHDGRTRKVSHHNFLAGLSRKLQLVVLRRVQVRVGDADVVDETGVVVSVLRGQRDRIAATQQQAGRDADR